MYYHVTATKNLPNIQRSGLKPKIGQRSILLGESENLIYLFKSREDAEDAVMNWLGDEFEEDERLALLEVNVPDNKVAVTRGAEYEYTAKSAIPANLIKVITKDL